MCALHVIPFWVHLTVYDIFNRFADSQDSFWADTAAFSSSPVNRHPISGRMKCSLLCSYTYNTYVYTSIAPCLLTGLPTPVCGECMQVSCFSSSASHAFEKDSSCFIDPLAHYRRRLFMTTTFINNHICIPASVYLLICVFLILCRQWRWRSTVYPCMFDLRWGSWSRLHHSGVRPRYDGLGRLYRHGGGVYGNTLERACLYA